VTLGILNGPTQTWMTLLLAFAAPSAIKSIIDLVNYFKQKPQRLAPTSGDIDSARTVVNNNEIILLTLKEANFSKPGTIEHKIGECVALGRTLSRYNFLESPDYWLVRYKEKRMQMLTFASLFGISGVFFLWMLLHLRTSTQNYWFMALSAGLMLGTVPLLFIRYRTFNADVLALSEFYDWRKRYGITVELALLQTRKGAELLQAEGSNASAT
jgi:hypothetical protein